MRRLADWLFRLGLWLSRRDVAAAATLNVAAPPPPRPAAEGSGPLFIVLTIDGQAVDFSARPQEEQRLVALNFFLSLPRRRQPRGQA